jgi:hypothetical protein
MEVFRRIERFYSAEEIAKEINGVQWMTYTIDSQKMIISDPYHSFTIDWVIDGKLNDLYYYTTPATPKTSTKQSFAWASRKQKMSYIHELKTNKMKVEIVKDNAFFLIFKSDIFDSPIKRRILQFLSYIFFEKSLSHIMPWMNYSDYLCEFVKNLEYQKSEIQ